MSIETFLKAITKDGLKVKASLPSDFNDPFECTGVVSGVPTDSLVNEYWRLRPYDYITFTKLHYLCGFTRNELNDEKDAVLKSLSGLISRRDFLSKGYRISCFSGDAHNRTYMWAHYGDMSRGIAIAFDFSKIDHLPLQRVEYRDNPVSIDLSTIDHIEQLQSFFETCVRTKSNAWEIEDEYRVIFARPDNGITQTIGKDDFWTIKSECIAKYVVGCEWENISGSVRNEVRSVITEYGLDLSKFYLAKRDFATYGYKEVQFMPYLFL